MLPDSRSPRRLPIVISAIDDDARSRSGSEFRPGTIEIELVDRRRRRHRDRHHVVDEQRGRGDEPEQRRQLLARHGVRAAAVGEGPADLAVGDRDDREQDRDRDRDLDARHDSASGARQHEDPQDLLGRVGATRRSRRS